MKITAKQLTGSVLVGTAMSVLAMYAPVVYAATTADSQLSQQINPGVLSTDILNGSGVTVASPSFSMSAATVSTQEQTVTGVFGSSSQRVSVDNPGASATGWTLALNATTPGTGVWTDGTNTYPYNGTATTGQLSVDPSVAALSAVVGTTTGIAMGTPAAFSGSTPIQLLNAGASSDDIWNGYLTDVGLSQVIPAGQPSGTYTFDLTQTVTAQ